MKKTILLWLVLAIACILPTGCSSCQSENTKQEVSDDLSTAKDVLGDIVVVKSDNQGGQLVAENIISTDRQWMFNHYGGEYIYFETEVIFKDCLNATTSTDEILQVRNVFQKVTDMAVGFDVHVFYATTNAYGTVYQKMDGFYVGNNPIKDEEVKLTFKDAYKRLMEANCNKPASRYCVLRKPVGDTKLAHPLYIFGNPKNGLVAVDAVTGDVIPYIGMPLGEWP